MYADNAADFTLALTLTVLFGLLTFLAWRSRGLGALLKGAGITMLPLALWLTHTLRLVSNIVGDIGDWATGLVFSPRVWVGLVVAAIAVVVFTAGTVVSRRFGASTGSASEKSTSEKSGTDAKLPSAPKAAKATRKASGDPEMDEIEAMLRKRGIS